MAEITFRRLQFLIAVASERSGARTREVTDFMRRHYGVEMSPSTAHRYLLLLSDMNLVAVSWIEPDGTPGGRTRRRWTLTGDGRVEAGRILARVRDIMRTSWRVEK